MGFTVVVTVPAIPLGYFGVEVRVSFDVDRNQVTWTRCVLDVNAVRNVPYSVSEMLRTMSNGAFLDVVVTYSELQFF